MKKFIFRCFIGILCLAVLASISFCAAVRHFTTDGNHLSKEAIFSLVKKNHSILLDASEAGQPEKAESIKGIREAFCKDGFAFFECGGYGMGSETGYYGFYYSPDDIAKPLLNGYPVCSEEDFLPEGNGYAYNEVEGDNRYYAERITNCFFYYEMHF